MNRHDASQSDLELDQQRAQALDIAHPVLLRAEPHDGVLDAARQDAIIEATWGFDECGDVGDYMKLLVV